jgi:heat-inducible transcriptional repressor
MKQDEKLLALLDVVIDTYINKGEPIGSKFLNSLEDVDYAPSTLRKYLNMLEKQGMVYQPYNSSGRIPTTDGLKLYIENYLQQIEEETQEEVLHTRETLKELVEMLGSLVDGVIIGFLRNDEYYYLGINNLLRDDLKEDYEETRNIIKFIEERRIVKYIDSKILKKNQIYYTFLDDQHTIISTVYAKVNIDGFDCILAIVGPTRVNYKKNVAILSQILQKME